MGTTVTVIPPISAPQFAARLSAVFPNGWASSDARQAGVMNFFLEALAVGLAFDITSLQYALAATRVQTAINGALDLASEDFFGSGLPRNTGESDDAFRARVLAALSMLGVGATRAAVTAAVYAATGVEPLVTEPWSPADTGVLDGLPGEGMMFLDVDAPGARNRLTDDDAYQGFIDSALPSVPLLGGNPLPCLDLGNSPNGWYVDAPASGSALFDFDGSTPTGKSVVYNAINKVKVFGTVAWVKFLPVPFPILHQ